MHISSAVRPDEIPDDFDFPDEWTPGELRENVPISIGARAETWCAPQEFHLVDVAHITQGDRHIYIWGWIDYSDVFAKTARHRTEFCFELMVIGNPDHPNPQNISVRTYRKHNGTDTECFRKPSPYIRPTR